MSLMIAVRVIQEVSEVDLGQRLRQVQKRKRTKGTWYIQETERQDRMKITGIRSEK